MLAGGACIGEAAAMLKPYWFGRLASGSGARNPLARLGAPASRHEAIDSGPDGGFGSSARPWRTTAAMVHQRPRGAGEGQAGKQNRSVGFYGVGLVWLVHEAEEGSVRSAGVRRVRPGQPCSGRGGLFHTTNSWTRRRSRPTISSRRPTTSPASRPSSCWTRMGGGWAGLGYLPGGPGAFDAALSRILKTDTQNFARAPKSAREPRKPLTFPSLPARGFQPLRLPRAEGYFGDQRPPAGADQQPDLPAGETAGVKVQDRCRGGSLQGDTGRLCSDHGRRDADGAEARQPLNPCCSGFPGAASLSLQMPVKIVIASPPGFGLAVSQL